MRQSLSTIIVFLASVNCACSESLDSNAHSANTLDGAADASVADRIDSPAPDAAQDAPASPDAAAPDANCLTPLVAFNEKEKPSGKATDGSGTFAFRVTFDQARVIGGIEFMTSTGDVPTAPAYYDLGASVYDDSNGRPGVLTAIAKTVTLDEKAEWRSLALKSPWSAKASTPYWIVFQPSSAYSGPIYLSVSESGKTFPTYWSYGGFGKWNDAGAQDMAWMVRLTGCP